MIKRLLIFGCLLYALVFSSRQICAADTTSTGNPATPLQLDLQHALALSLTENPQLLISRIEAEQERNTLLLAYGYFDPTLVAFWNMNDQEEPTSSPFQIPGPSFFDPSVESPVNQAFTIQRRDYSWGASLGGNSPLGGTYSIAYEQSYLKTDNAFTTLVPEITASLAFAFRQNLLKGFGLRTNLGGIKIASNLGVIADQDIAAVSEKTLQDVHRAYLELVLALQVQTIIEHALDYAKEIERMARARIKAGVDTEISLLEAQTRVADRAEKLIVAENASYVAEERLKLLLAKQPSAEIWQKKIIPVFRPQFFPYTSVEEVDLPAALKQRPEIIAAEKSVESAKLYKKIQWNRKLPQLDLLAEFGFLGLDGYQNIYDPSGNQVGDFTGGVSGAAGDLFSGEYPYWELGIELTYPLANATARSEYISAKLAWEKRKTERDNLLQTVTVELNASAHFVRSEAKRVTATQTAFQAASKNLKAGENKHRLGVMSTRDLLELEEEKDNFEAGKYRALVDYHLAVASYEKAKGTLRQYFKVGAIKKESEKK